MKDPKEPFERELELRVELEQVEDADILISWHGDSGLWGIC